MSWSNDTFYYSIGILKAIASWYDQIYEVLMIGDYQITNLWVIVDFKADYDRALSSIGRTKWEGLNSTDFGDYKHYGKLQRVVIADMLGIEDTELQAWGFFDIPQYRYTAYKRMIDSLNGG